MKVKHNQNGCAFFVTFAQTEKNNHHKTEL